jgi:hypothetical protein
MIYELAFRATRAPKQSLPLQPSADLVHLLPGMDAGLDGKLVVIQAWPPMQRGDQAIRVVRHGYLRVREASHRDHLSGRR